MTFPSTSPLRAPTYKGAITKSLYIAMRDGVHLAVDLCLPKGLSTDSKITTLFAATRYWRAQQLKFPFSWFISIPDSARDFYISYGFALLRIDMRGTGASEGDQPHPWPATDLFDLYDLVEWVIHQPWSNGKVAGFGNSYQATTAEMLGACGHPAVTSALVRFNEYDVYNDIAFPGGVPNHFILTEWAEYNRVLDANQLPQSVSATEKRMIKGVKQVNGKKVPVHHNGQVNSALHNIVFRDDYDPELKTTLEGVSIYNRPTRHTIDHWGSWFDASTADAVIHRFANTPRSQRAVIGAWNHGAKQQVGMDENPFPFRAQMEETVRFFDSPVSTRMLHYFTLFENKWKSVSEWPPAGFTPTRLFFEPQGVLTKESPVQQSEDTFTVDFSNTTGCNNRWQTELDQRPVHYSPIEAPLSYTSTPLEKDIEITGHPVVTLYVKSTHPDGNFFVYLEGVDEENHPHYLCEGMLRAVHLKISTDTSPYKQFVPYHSYKREDAMPLIPGEIAKLEFGLHPISARISKGWKIKLSITGADKDTFARIPVEGNPVINILLGGEFASSIVIPIKTL